MFNLSIPERLARIPFNDRRVARLGRLSTKKQGDGQAKERQTFDLNNAAKMIGPLRDDLMFFDLDSGNNDDRDGFQAVMSLIDEREIDALVILKLERLSRSLVTLAELWNVFSQSECELFIDDWGRFVDFSKYSPDKDKFSDDSVAASKESSRIARRVFSGWQWTRHKGKAPYKMPFGFKRIDGKYVKHPEERAIAEQLVEQFFDPDSPCYLNFRQTAHWVNDQDFPDVEIRGVKWVRQWLVHPAVRGDTRYKATGEIRRDTHEGYLSRKQFEALEKVVEDNKRTRGFIPTVYPLTSLCVCGYCGEKMRVQTVKKKWKNHTNTYQYLRCRSLYDIHIECSHKPKVPYQWVEKELIKAIAAHAETIGKQAGEAKATPEPNPRIAEIEEKIGKIKRSIDLIGDEDGALTARIAKLKEEVLTLEPEEINADIEEMKEAMEALKDPSFWDDIEGPERREYFLAIVSKLRVFRDGDRRWIEVDWNF